MEVTDEYDIDCIFICFQVDGGDLEVFGEVFFVRERYQRLFMRGIVPVVAEIIYDEAF